MRIYAYIYMYIYIHIHIYIHIYTYASVSCSPCKSLDLSWKDLRILPMAPMAHRPIGPWRPFSATSPRPLCPAEHGDIPTRLHFQVFTPRKTHDLLVEFSLKGKRGSGNRGNRGVDLHIMELPGLQKGKIEDLQIEDGHLARTSG